MACLMNPSGGIFSFHPESLVIWQRFTNLLEEITKADHDKPDWVEMCSSWDWARLMRPQCQVPHAKSLHVALLSTLTIAPLY